MTGSKTKEKDDAPATEEPAEDSFESGWAEAAPSTPDEPSDENQDDEDSGSQETAADDSTKRETPPSDTDDGDEQGAKKGEAAATRSDDDPSSKAEDASSEDETPAEGAGDEPQTVEERLDALQESLAKNDRDQKAEIGRLRKQNKDLLARMAAKDEPGELPEDVQAAYDKLKDFDPEMAETMSKIMAHQRSQVDQKFQSGVEYASQVSEAEQAQQLAVLDAELKDIPWQEYLARDTNGQFSHAQFVQFLGDQPARLVNEFIYTEDAGPVAKMVRSFHASLDDAAPKDPDTTDDGADGDQKATSQAKRRAAQKAATDGAVPSKGSGAKDADDDDEDSFDSGWKAAARQERRHAA